MKIAIVHDFLNQFGGAERVLSALHELYPEAPIFTSIYDQGKLPENFRRMDIRVSFMQNLPFASTLFRQYFFLYPMAFESFNLSEYDLLLSSSSAYAKGIKKRDNQLHICYCHNPMRFVWRYEEYIKMESIPSFLKSLLPFLLEPIKNWDLQNTRGVDYFIANSKTVADRIQKIYQRESVIINPPVETEVFLPSPLDHDYFLLVSRLNAYKRIDIVVEAFNRLKLHLKIVGDGPERKTLAVKSGQNIEFLGRIPELELAQTLAECRALVFPGEEDFGIVPLEAMASGRPVIAFRAGGAEETILEDNTGVFFDKQTPESLESAIKRFQFMLFDKKRIREHAQKFDKKIFKQNISNFVELKYAEWKK